MLVRITKTLLMAGLLVLLIFAINSGWLEHLTDSNWVAGYLRQNGAWAWGAIFVAGVLFTAVGGPRQVLAFVCGFAMGGLQGALFSTLATLVGALCCFLLARTLFRNQVHRLAGRKLDKLEKLLRNDAWLKVTMIRLMPVGSNLLTNLFLGNTRVAVASFAVGSTLGYLPQMLIFAFAGAGVGFADDYQLLISLGLLLLSAILATYLYQSRARREVEEIV